MPIRMGLLNFQQTFKFYWIVVVSHSETNPPRGSELILLTSKCIPTIILWTLCFLLTNIDDPKAIYKKFFCKRLVWWDERRWSPSLCKWSSTLAVLFKLCFGDDEHIYLDASWPALQSSSRFFDSWRVAMDSTRTFANICHVIWVCCELVFVRSMAVLFKFMSADCDLP